MPAVSSTPRAAMGIPSLRWTHFALTIATAVVLFALNEAGIRIGSPGAVLLVPLAYVSAVAGATGGMIAGLPLLGAYAYLFFAGRQSSADEAESLRNLTMFILAGGSIALIVGRATTRRRQLAAQELNAVRTEGDTLLAQSEGLNRTVLDSLPAHVAVIDASGKIITTNLAWRRFQAGNDGESEACDIGSNYLTASRSATGGDAAAGNAVADGIEAVLQGKVEQFVMEYACHAPDQQRWFLLTVTPLSGKANETMRGAVVSHLNITDRKQIEETTRRHAIELARHAAALKASNEELDQFAYITSHDLRAPLRGIANLSSWIEEDMGDRITPEARQQLDLMRGRVHRMEAMIDGILEYARVGRVQVHVQTFDVGKLVADVVDLLDPPPGFQVDNLIGTPVVEGHKLSLQQVFLNLIGNAVKHHDKTAGRIVVSCRDAGAFFEFSVADDGPGIEEKYHQKVFVIFQTLQARDKIESTGVGLSLVKKIIESEGGRISIESGIRGAPSNGEAAPDEQGRGTTFRFTWPKRLPSATQGSDHRVSVQTHAVQGSSAVEKPGGLEMSEPKART